MRYAGGFEGRKEKGVNGEITVSILKKNIVEAGDMA